MTNTWRIPVLPHLVTAGRVALSSVTVAVAALAATACGLTPQTAPLSPSAVTSSTESKPGGVTLATMTFADQAGDAITSDGQGAYPPYNGSSGCELLSGQLTCILSGTSRSLNYNLNNVVSGSGPTGTLNDSSNFTVDGAGGLAIGSSMLAQALFHTAIGQFNFNAAGDSNTNSVFVRRVDAHTWTIDTSAGDVANLTHSVQDPHNPHKTITAVWGYYHLPVHFTAVTQ